MKRIMFALFMLVALVSLANAQFQGTTCELIPGPCAERIARQAYAPIDRILGAAGSGGYYGGGVGIGGVSRRTTVIGSIIAGAVMGGTLGGRRGAIIGGGAGFGASMLVTRGGSAAAGPSAGGGRGDFELSNLMRYPADIYFRNQKGKDKFLGRLGSGDTWAVQAPKPGESYYGYTLIPNYNGGLSSDRLYPIPTTNGWAFEEPAEAAQGGR